MARNANIAEFQRWLAQAQYDLEAARSSSSAGNFEWASFQAQQAAEKELKSFLFLNGRRAVISHSVTNLLRDCEEIDSSFGRAHSAKNRTRTT